MASSVSPPTSPRERNVLVRPIHALFRGIRQSPWLSLAAGLILLVLLVLGAVNLWAYYHYRAAQKALRDDHLPEARRHIDKCLQVNEWLQVWKPSVPSHLLAARIARLSDDPDDTELHLHECQRIQGGATEATQIEWLLLRAQQGQLEEVEAGLWTCINDNHPDSSLILEGLARAYMGAQRYGWASHCLDLLLEREPGMIRALYWRGQVRDRMSAREQASEDFTEALKLDPDRTDIRLALANLLLEAKKAREALPHYQRLRAAEPDHPEPLVGLARCHLLQGELQEARESFDEALAISPDHFQALLYYGELEVQSGNYSRAEEILRHAVRLSPHDPEAHYLLYESLQKQSLRLPADKKLKKAAEDEQFVYESIKKDLTTIDLRVNSQVEKTRQNPELATEVGEIFLRLGNDRLGVSWLYQALKVDRDYKPAHRALADHFEKVGEREKAAEHRKLAAPARTPQSVP